jgi:hexosaminidase
VLDEVLPLFPSTYIHVGGDECPKANWKRCPDCQKRMKDNNLKDEHQLQSYFIQRMEKYLNSKGRILIGWDEILEGGLAPNAVVMSWRGEEGGIAAAKEKHKVIMSPQKPVYFDHTQTEREDSVTIGGYNPLEQVYAYDPIAKGMNKADEKYVLGGQANLWKEYIKNDKKVEYMIFPRMSALSEILWSPKQKRNFRDFEKRLETQFKRYKLWGANYSTAFFDLKATVSPTEDHNGVYWKFESKHAGDSIGFITPLALSVSKYKLPYTQRILQTGDYGFRLINPTVQAPVTLQKFHFNKATGKKITLAKPASSNYPGDGPFTLVDGIQNEKGMGKSKEFLGFNGTDCEAIIDLGRQEEISTIKAYILEQNGAWIYRPSYVKYYTSNDGKTFQEITDGISPDVPVDGALRNTEVMFSKRKARFVKVYIKNFGIVPDGKPGAGHLPWLFVDEIEVN